MTRALVLLGRWPVSGHVLNACLSALVTLCLQANEPGRAEQLRGIIERLGPAYVKVAQALSTRVDLLSPQYFTQIQLLQDRVPPFPCDQAKEVRRGTAWVLLHAWCAYQCWDGCVACHACIAAALGMQQRWWADTRHHLSMHWPPACLQQVL